MIEEILREILNELVLFREFRTKYVQEPVPAPAQSFIEVAQAAIDTPAPTAAPFNLREPVPAVPAPAPTREQIGNALVMLATSKGRDTAVAVLKKFGAAKVADVKESDYGVVFAAIVEASK